MVLAYHDIGDDPSNRTQYYVSPARFRHQLLVALDLGLRLVDLAALADTFRRAARASGRCRCGGRKRTDN